MTVISSAYTGNDLWKPRLCVLNEVATATITASTSATNHSASAVRGPQTYSTWSPTALPGWVEAEWSGGADVDFIACYVTVPDGCTLQGQYLIGTTWTNAGTSITPTTAGPLVWLFNKVTGADAIRVYVTGSGTPYIANVKAGLCTVAPVGVPSGFIPGAISPHDEYTNTFSEGGQVLGSQRLRSMMSQDVQLDMLEPAWVRSDWDDVRVAMRTEGVYFAWNPDDYSDEVVYGMVTGTPKVSYSSPTFMSLSFALSGPSP